MRERGETVNVPPEDQLKIAGKVKENYSYVCQDIVREFRKYDAEPYKYFERFDGEHSVTGRVSDSCLCITCSMVQADCVARNTPSMSATSVSSHQKYFSTLKFTHPISLPHFPILSTTLFSLLPLMFAAVCTR
jgi:hypothetical protein